MASQQAPRGLAAGLRGVAASLIENGQTRLALAATELEEEWLRATRMLVLLAVSLFLLGLGVVMVALFVVVVFWDTHRLAAIGTIAVLFVGIGVGAALNVRRMSLNRPGIFAATIGELRKDVKALRRGIDDRDSTP